MKLNVFSLRESNRRLMKKINKKSLQKVICIWVGCTMVFMIVYLSIIAPQAKSKSQVEERLNEMASAYESARNTAKEKIQKIMQEQIEELRSRLGRYVVDAEDSADLTFDISRIANEKKIRSFSIKNNDILASKDNISESSIDLAFKASFNQFASLLNSLERHSPIVFVDRFKIDRSDVSGSDNNITISLSVFVNKQQDG
jgi:type II secretory pathway component PulM